MIGLVWFLFSSFLPGKDNIPDMLTDDVFGNNLYHQGLDNLTLLNLGYYNHWFKHNRPGAMGTSVSQCSRPLFSAFDVS